MPTDLRCTRVARALGHRPAGTAGSAAAFVLVEAPLPWPSDVGAHPLLAPLAPVVGGAGGRLQAVVPPPGAEPGTTTVVVFRRAAVGFDRVERSVPTGDLVDELAAMLTTNLPPKEQQNPLLFRGQVRDVLVCTHGSRDVCCGADGMRLYGQLIAREVSGVRVWRTSHTGGHRFAPTALTFPDGRAWAWLDADLGRGIVERSVPAAEAAAHDRGSLGLDDPFAQAAESTVFGAEGWSWLDRPHRVVVDAADPEHRVVTVTSDDDVAYRVEVALRGTVPVPDCGHPLDEARKTSPDLEVTSLTRIRP